MLVKGASVVRLCQDTNPGTLTPALTCHQRGRVHGIGMAPPQPSWYIISDQAPDLHRRRDQTNSGASQVYCAHPHVFFSHEATPSTIPLNVPITWRSYHDPIFADLDHDDVTTWKTRPVTGPLWQESTGHRWFPPGRESIDDRWVPQWWGKCFHAITLSSNGQPPSASPPLSA